jgi:GNAT superfamily N-acetyltransferase
MITIETISRNNVAALKMVRLWALRDSPTAFGSTYATESKVSDAEWLERASQWSGRSSVGYLVMDAENACGIVRATLDQQDPSVAWIESMWVAPSQRKAGIGRRLVDEILAWARGRGLRGLKL